MSRAEAGSPSAGVVLQGLSNYYRASMQPLHCLVFILPLVIFYEVGTSLYASDPAHNTEQRIIAFTMMRRLFAAFGANGRYLPAFAVVMILLAWHIAQKDKWRVDVAAVLGMYAESILLALPLLLIGQLLRYHLPLYGGEHHWQAMYVLSVGAGIYEELVFRLMLFAILSFLLMDLLKLDRRIGALLMVVGSSFLFSIYHYWGPEQFALSTFVFRTVAGAYFSGLFLTRGFGVTVGAHAAYDIVVVAMLRAAAIS